MVKLTTIAVTLAMLPLGGCIGDDVNKQANENEKICQQAPYTEHCSDPLYNPNSWEDYKEK